MLRVESGRSRQAYPLNAPPQHVSLKDLLLAHLHMHPGIIFKHTITIQHGELAGVAPNADEIKAATACQLGLAALLYIPGNCVKE